MGTNYYVPIDECRTCGRGEHLHIGKASAGWKFGFGQYDEDPKCRWPTLWTAQEWFAFLRRPGRVIRDEYGDDVPVDEFIQMVKDRQNEEYGGDATHRERLDAEGYRFITTHPDTWS